MKKNLKKLLASSAAVMLTLTLASCGGTEPETTETTPEATETAPETTETAPEATETAPEATTDAPVGYETESAKLFFDTSAYVVNESEADGIIMASIADNDMTKIISYQEYKETALPYEELVAEIDAQFQGVDGVEFISEETVQIGGVDASKKSYTMEIGGEKILQTNYAMQKDDVVIIEMATAYDDEGMADLEAIITSTELK